MSKLKVLAPEAPAAPEPAQSPLHFAASLSPKRVYIDTFGCQMNMHDSQRMVSLMAAEGYAPTDTPESLEQDIVEALKA